MPKNSLETKPGKAGAKKKTENEVDLIAVTASGSKKRKPTDDLQSAPSSPPAPAPATPLAPAGASAAGANSSDAAEPSSPSGSPSKKTDHATFSWEGAEPLAQSFSTWVEILSTGFVNAHKSSMSVVLPGPIYVLKVIALIQSESNIPTKGLAITEKGELVGLLLWSAPDPTKSKAVKAAEDSAKFLSNRNFTGPLKLGMEFRVQQFLPSAVAPNNSSYNCPLVKCGLACTLTLNRTQLEVLLPSTGPEAPQTCLDDFNRIQLFEEGWLCDICGTLLAVDVPKREVVITNALARSQQLRLKVSAALADRLKPAITLRFANCEVQKSGTQRVLALLEGNDRYNPQLKPAVRGFVPSAAE